MNRYNIFYQVHKGLRTFLFETAVLIQQTDFDNAEETRKAVNELKSLVVLFEKHAHAEDTLVFDVVKHKETGMINLFEQEHEKDNELGKNLFALADELDSAILTPRRILLGKLLNHAFMVFMIFNLEHMTREEDMINQALWRYYSDDELAGITEQIVAGIPPAEMALFSKWMMRGLSNNEIISWLKNVKDNAPGPVFHALIQTAETELSTSRLQLVQDAIMEGAMIAN